MTPQPVFPDDLRRQAYAVGNGELFWPLSVAAAAVEAIASAGHGIHGGEVYVGRGRAWGNIEFEWATEPARAAGETWGDYVARGRKQALAAVEQALRTLPAEAEALGSAREPMCFFPHGPEGTNAPSPPPFGHD